jgi:hypothetical protein
MLEGEGFRVPVFNVWVRLFVEIGIAATLLLVYLMVRALRSKSVLPQVKILLLASMVFGLSADSYIYGVFTFALFLAFCLVNVKERTVNTGRQRSPSGLNPSVRSNLDTETS